MIKEFISAALMAVSLDAAAESVSFDSFSIELPSGWVYRIVSPSPPDSAFGDRISVRQPEGPGVLYFQTYTAAAPVDEAALRDLTNVPAAKLLENREWGDFAGYQHDYVENGVFYRTWWLAQDANVLFITYQCDEGQESLELADVERVVLSLSSPTLPNQDTGDR